jgi:PQQ-dependent dehydrogenase (methanol/ethanol family)
MQTKLSASLIAMAVAGGMSGAALANDDVLRLSADPGNMLMPSIHYNGWNHSELDQINLDTVKDLQVAWTWQIGITDSHEAPPLVVGDTMYIASPKPNYVYALDLSEQGKVIWEFRPTMDVELATAQTCCGSQTRALYYAEDKIFYATLDGQIIALDAKSGEQLWHNVGVRIEDGEGMAGNGLIVGDKFIVGNEGGERGARGKVHAYNINTGKQEWLYYNMGPNLQVGVTDRFQPFYDDDKIDNPMADSWFGDSWKTGGGTSWGYFSWDPELNLVYYSTGNCGPWNADYRREWGVVDFEPVRQPGEHPSVGRFDAGDPNIGTLPAYKNNYCASQMARDGTTGELVWAYNITPADPWDIDEPLITQIVDFEIDGVMRKTALKAARDGYMYIWDAATGEILNQPWMFEYTDITLGVDTELGRPIYNIDQWPFTHVEDRRKYTDADPWPEGNRPEGFVDWSGTEIEYCPSVGTRNWENDTYSPMTGLLYTATDTDCRTMVMLEGEYVPGESYTLQRRAGPRGAAQRKDLDGNPTEVLTKLMANDPLGGRTVWVNNYNTTRRAPIMSTAGGLLFQGGNDTGVFRAINQENGDVVWEFRTGSAFNQTPITYLHDGKQYVAIISSVRPGDTQVAADAEADADIRYRRQGTTLYVWALPG